MFSYVRNVFNLRAGAGGRRCVKAKCGIGLGKGCDLICGLMTVVITQSCVCCAPARTEPARVLRLV